MSPELRSLEVVVLALIVLAAAYWQQHLIRRDCSHPLPPRRLYIPLATSALVLIGYVFLGILGWADPRKPDFDAADFFEMVAKALVFAVALNVKTLLGPLFVAYTLGATVYCYVEYREWEFWPLLDLLLDWVFDGMPRWFKYAYLSVTFVYALVASIVEEWIG